MEYVYIADTNLFFECKNLDELRWFDLEGDPITVLLTKPVIGEIDKHKRAGGRTRKRAVAISGQIREMLNSDSMELSIQEAGPRVVLRIAPMIKPDPELENVLDYTQNDDRIVGIVSAMVKEAKNVAVSFFTDDSVAASTAHSLGLPFRLIEEAWKRPPEETTEAKRIKELEKDLATYRAQEPRILIRDVSAKDGAARVVRRVPLVLDDRDVQRMVADLRIKFPMQEDFSTPDPETLVDGTEITFEPPDPEQVEKYKNDAYPSWIEECRRVLEGLHEGRVEHEATVRLVWGIKNEGTRPASQVRITFEAEGSLMLRHVVKKKDTEEDVALDTIPAPKSMPRLPKPPEAPQMNRIIKPPSESKTDLKIHTLRPSAALQLTDLERMTTEASALSKLQKNLGTLEMPNSLSKLLGLDYAARQIIDEQEKFRHLMLGSLSESETASLNRIFVLPPFHTPIMPSKQEEEEFYFDEDWTPNEPVSKGELTCHLFRHQMAERLFEFEVLFPSHGNVRGAVLCTVHAENLTKPVKERIKVIRTIEEFSLLEQAEAIVANCGE